MVDKPKSICSWPGNLGHDAIRFDRSASCPEIRALGISNVVVAVNKLDTLLERN